MEKQMKEIKNCIEKSMQFMLPNVAKKSPIYRDFAKLILAKLEEHQCAVLWRLDENFVSLLEKHKIPIDTIGNKEAIIGLHYVHIRNDFHNVKEKVIYTA